MRLKERVAIVTGAAQGIGARYIKALAAEGAKTVIVDIEDCENTKTFVHQEIPNAILATQT